MNHVIYLGSLKIYDDIFMHKFKIYVLFSFRTCLCQNPHILGYPMTGTGSNDMCSCS